MRIRFILAALSAGVMLPASIAGATDLEVTHWWTSGGEAAAVAELAKAFDATGNKWVDGAIAGSGGTARPIMISRITGGDPMGATQFNHGRQAEELVQSGLMRDLSDVAEKGKWKEVIKPSSLLDSCTIDGKIYCAPVNIHSWQWLWLSNAAFKKAGVEVPKNWNEFVAAAPALQKAGIQPLALGGQSWQANGLFDTLMIALSGKDLYEKVYKDKDAKVAAGPDLAKIFAAADVARQLAKGSNVQDWNQATNMVITGKAAGQIMGDWAQGEFQLANQKAGTDYTCLPGLGLNEYLTANGDAFYFPLLKDEAKSKAQEVLAEVIVDPKTQVAFNLKKGSLPIRGDVDLGTANDCMKKGLDILAKGEVLQSTDQLISADTQKQKEDLMSEFFANASLTPEAAQKRFAEIIASAD